MRNLCLNRWQAVVYKHVLLFLVAGLALVNLSAQGQIFNAPRTLDPVTQQTLNELKRKPVTPDSVDEIERLVMRVVNGSGYIRELAPLFYRMANGDTQLARVSQNYMTIIEQWPESAWAQKALIELVPLLEMSEGELALEFEREISAVREVLLSLSEDASAIGESDRQLQGEVWWHLVQLAHVMNDAGLIQSLLGHPVVSGNPYRAEAELALHSVQISHGGASDASASVQAWIAANPTSLLVLYAHSLLLETGARGVDASQLPAPFANAWPTSLEAKTMQRFSTLPR